MPLPIPQEVLEKAKRLGNIFTVLEKIESIVSDDFCEDMSFKLTKGRLTTENEKVMTEKLVKIYKLAHAFSRTCGHNHPDWKEEALK